MAKKCMANGIQMLVIGETHKTQHSTAQHMHSKQCSKRRVSTNQYAHCMLSCMSVVRPALQSAHGSPQHVQLPSMLHVSSVCASALALLRIVASRRSCLCLFADTVCGALSFHLPALIACVIPADTENKFVSTGFAEEISKAAGGERCNPNVTTNSLR
jgi:hypothetical protein